MVLAAAACRPSRNLGATHVIPVNAASVIYQGALVMVDADGFARPAAALASNQGCLGVAVTSVTGGASDGDTSVVVQEGEFLFTLVGGAQTDFNLLHYASADDTASQTQASNEPVAGRLTQFVSSTSGWLFVGRNP